MQHRIIDTCYGEVMVRNTDCDEYILEVYIGDNFDDFIGEININYWFSSDAEIAKAVERLLE